MNPTAQNREIWKSEVAKVIMRMVRDRKGEALAQLIELAAMADRTEVAILASLGHNAVLHRHTARIARRMRQILEFEMQALGYIEKAPRSCDTVAETGGYLAFCAAIEGRSSAVCQWLEAAEDTAEQRQALLH